MILAQKCYKKRAVRDSQPDIIGKTGFEPATPWSQTRCSTKLSYFPLMIAELTTINILPVNHDFVNVPSGHEWKIG